MKTDFSFPSALQQCEPLALKIHDFWFGELDDDAMPSKQKAKAWFQKDPAIDQIITRQFAGILETAVMGALDRYLLNEASATALIILLDQFPRQIYRTHAKSFYHDHKALGLSRQCLQRGYLAYIPIVWGYFILMPFMHSEALEIQDEGLVRFQDLLARCPEKSRAEAMIRSALEYAQSHRDIIKRFGRFPHRNQILGRNNSDAEVEFLRQPGSSF